MTDLRGFLRAETRDLHERLDEIVGLFRTIEDYDRFLLGSFRHRHATEAALGEFAGEAPLSRPMLPLLVADLADRGLPIPAAERLDLSKDIASALGATYVLEGSALGARVLVKSAASLGMSATHGARYLSAQAGTTASWRELLVRLDSVETLHWHRALSAARRVFDHAIQAFSLRELPAA